MVVFRRLLQQGLRSRTCSRLRYVTSEDLLALDRADEAIEGNLIGADRHGWERRRNIVIRSAESTEGCDPSRH